MSFMIASSPSSFFSPLRAHSADPRMMGMSSPGNCNTPRAFGSRQRLRKRGRARGEAGETGGGRRASEARRCQFAPTAGEVPP
jgi:hypothetical protein